MIEDEFCINPDNETDEPGQDDGADASPPCSQDGFEDSNMNDIEIKDIEICKSNNK